MWLHMKNRFKQCSLCFLFYNSNPLISQSSMKALMEGRRMVRLGELASRSKDYLKDNDWVTIGVIVNRSETKMSAKVFIYLLYYSYTSTFYDITCSATTENENNKI